MSLTPKGVGEEIKPMGTLVWNMALLKGTHLSLHVKNGLIMKSLSSDIVLTRKVVILK